MLASGFIRYGPEGDMQYDELLVSVLARAGASIGATIPLIWVDSPASSLAGRELWAIPKQLASFTAAGDEIEATVDGKLLARCVFSARRRLRWMPPARLSVLQARGHSLLRTPVHIRAACELARAQWQIPSESPLAMLRHHQPLLSVRLRDARIRFGS